MAHSNQWNGADAGLALLEQSWSLSEVACWMRAAVGSVYQWRQAWRVGGLEAVAPQPVPVTPRQLIAELYQP